MKSLAIALTTTLLVIFVRLTECVAATSCVGCVDLDEITFDKVIRKFKYAVVKFDTAFPYGDKHEAYGSFARKAFKSSDDILVAHVGVKDYGEMENKPLAKRFKVKIKDFPVIIFFRDGNVQNYTKYPLKKEITVENLNKFVMENSDLYIGFEGCLKEFNELIKGFTKKTNDEIQQLIQKGVELLNAQTSDEDKASAKFYLTFMKKIAEKGPTFVQDEMARLKKLESEKLTAAKKVEIQHKLNILQTFQEKVDEKEKEKDRNEF